jgi:predicted AlkP superfamily phosphohydrolase/phosphomutase
MMLNHGERVLVIGLDGATFKVLEALMDAGELPNLTGASSFGARGLLRSVYPTNSIAAWASFATGKNPGQHGLYDFFVRRRGSYERAVVNASFLEERTLWELLSEAGKREIIVNVPLTYPPFSVKGAMLSGMLSPFKRDVATYPPGLGEEIRKALGEYTVDMGLQPFLRGEASLSQQIECMISVVHKRTETMLYLMSRKAWDFAMLVFTGLDRLQHFIWHHLDPSHTRHVPAEAEAARPAIMAYFRALDEAVGQLRAAAEPDITFIISDHGFGPLEKRLHLNEWLRREGLLFYRRMASSPLSPRLVRRLLKLDRFGVRRLLPRGIRSRYIPEKLAARTLSARFGDINWERTKAYGATLSEQCLGLHINLKGREPNGIVSLGREYEALLKD